MGDPSEMQDELDAEKGDISQPGGVQQDSEAAFEAELDQSAKDEPL